MHKKELHVKKAFSGRFGTNQVQHDGPALSQGFCRCSGQFSGKTFHIPWGSKHHIPPEKKPIKGIKILLDTWEARPFPQNATTESHSDSSTHLIPPLKRGMLQSAECFSAGGSGWWKRVVVEESQNGRTRTSNYSLRVQVDLKVCARSVCTAVGHEKLGEMGGSYGNFSLVKWIGSSQAE